MTTTDTRPVDNGVNVEALLGAREALAEAGGEVTDLERITDFIFTRDT